MRRAIVQIQNTNVHTPRPMRGAIPRAQNLRFATVSRDRPTESYERVHPAKSKCAFRYSGVPSKMSKCTFRYSGVHGNVWNERIASAVARGIQKSSFHHSFERPTSTKWRKGSPSQPGLAGATYKFTVKMTSTWSPCAIYTVYTTISPGLAGATYKFTVKMTSTWSPRAIYTVYTTILPGLAGVTYKFTVKMKPTRNLYGIHNDFCGVGGGLRRGCILIRNRDGLGMMTFFALAHMWHATQLLGWWGGVGWGWWRSLHLHTCDMLRNCWGGGVGCVGDDDVLCTCTHVTCYATAGVVGWGGLGMMTFFALAHMWHATQLLGWWGGVGWGWWRSLHLHTVMEESRWIFTHSPGTGLTPE